MFQRWRLPAFITSQTTKISTSFFLFFFWCTNLFYKNVPPEICQNIKNMLRTYPRLGQEQFIFHCFNFPKSRKSELHNVFHGIRVRVKVFSFNTFLLCVWSIIRFHCTCTIHLYGNYNHCLILSICSLKVIRFPLLKLKNIRKNISWLKLPRK